MKYIKYFESFENETFKDYIKICYEYIKIHPDEFYDIIKSNLEIFKELYKDDRYPKIMFINFLNKKIVEMRNLFTEEEIVNGLKDNLSSIKDQYDKYMSDKMISDGEVTELPD
jgi:hypothetical protein